MTGLWVVAASGRMQLRDMRSSQVALIAAVVQPVVFTMIMINHPGRPATGPPSAAIAIGVALTALWGATIWTSGGVLRREARSGTLAANVTSVRPGYLVLLGKSLAAALLSATVIAASTAATTLLLGGTIPVSQPAWFAAGLLTVIASSIALGMLLSTVFLVTRHGPQVSAALMYPVYLLGGLLIPPGLLPEELQWTSALVSLRWGNELMVAATRGQAGWQAFAPLLGLTICYFVLAVWAFTKVVRVARRDATLDLI